jgi:hypothetical protein
MSSVHGIIVFGGTFPAEIWNSVYSEGGVPCEEFTPPAQPISWSPFYGEFTQSNPRDHGGNGAGGGGPPPPGTEAVGGYDPNAYAPGAGQEPAPLPPPLPEPPQSGVDGGESAGSG